MKGTRVTTFGDLRETVGAYMKDSEGIWWCHVPVPASTTGKAAADAMGALSGHTITEHEDGTITASPSILMEHGQGGGWHGYLEHGEWREC